MYMNVFCVLTFSFMAASTYWIAESMVEVLMKPFKNAPDAYNSDNFCAARTACCSLRYERLSIWPMPTLPGGAASYGGDGRMPWTR